MPVYLTKQERRKLRKATRAAREQEKRDQQLLGLLPAAEPKLKLSNFMKILGTTLHHTLCPLSPRTVCLCLLSAMHECALSRNLRTICHWSIMTTVSSCDVYGVVEY